MTQITYFYEKNWTYSKSSIEERANHTGDIFDENFPYYLEEKWENFRESLRIFCETYNGLLLKEEQTAVFECQKLSSLFQEILRTSTEIFDIIGNKIQKVRKRKDIVLSDKDREKLNKIIKPLRNKSATLNNKIKHENRIIKVHLTTRRNLEKTRYFTFVIMVVSKLKKEADNEFHKRKISQFSFIKWIDEIISNLYEADFSLGEILSKNIKNNSNLLNVKMLDNEVFWIFHSFPKLITDGELQKVRSMHDMLDSVQMIYSHYERPKEGMQSKFRGKARKGETISLTGRY